MDAARLWRTGLVGVVAVTVGLGGFSAQSAAADGRVASAAPKDTVWDRQWQTWRQAAQAAGFTFEYFVNGELGGENEILNALRRDRLQVAGTSSAAVAAVIPEVSVALAPFQFESVAEADFVYDRYLFPVLSDIARDYGLHLMAWREVGWSHIYATRKIVEPGDVKGLKLRGPTNIPHQEFLRSVGADAIPLGLPDIVPALQTGMIDGGIANIVLHSATTAAFARHYTLTGHIFDTNFFYANLPWYRRLAPERQRALDGLIADPAAARAEIRGMSDALLAALRANPAADVVDVPADVLARWRSAASPALAKIVAQSGPRAAEVAAAIAKGRAAFNADRRGGP
jgi:TRAP-type C4-dicarboxylate transport system substrate-binding protein